MHESENGQPRRQYDPRELVRTGHEQARSIADRAVIALDYYNEQLLTLQEQIRAAQPRQHGAVLLELNRCGRHCAGCPHPYWVKWINRHHLNRKAAPSWFATRIERPGVAARASHIPAEVSALIRQAQTVIEQRRKLLHQLSQLSRTTTALANASDGVEAALHGDTTSA